MLPCPTDASGAGSLKLSLPHERTLLGQTFYFQNYVYDPKANAAGFAWTGAVRALLGGF